MIRARMTLLTEGLNRRVFEQAVRLENRRWRFAERVLFCGCLHRPSWEPSVDKAREKLEDGREMHKFNRSLMLRIPKFEDARTPAFPRGWGLKNEARCR